MVNPEMFKGAFNNVPKVNLPAAKPQPVQYEDPEIAKMKALLLKWLTIIIAGGAIALIVWRIILKFI